MCVCVYIWNEIKCLFKVSYNTERDGRMIFETMHSIRTIGRDRFCSPKMDIGYMSLILYQCRTQAATLGLFGNYIRSRWMFFFRIIARATTPIFLLLFSRSPHMLLFSRWSPLLSDQQLLSCQPLISQSSSVGVPLKARLIVENIIPLSLPLSISIILHKSFINMVYTPLNPPPLILPSFIVLLT